MQNKLLRITKTCFRQFNMMSLPQHYGILMNPNSPISNKLDSLEILISSKEMTDANYTPMITPISQLLSNPEFYRYLSQRENLKKKLEKVQEVLIKDEEGDGIELAIKFLAFQQQYRNVDNLTENIKTSINEFLDKADDDKILSKINLLNPFFNFGASIKEDKLVNKLKDKYMNSIDKEFNTLSINSKCLYLRYLFVCTNGKSEKIHKVKEDIIANVKECELDDIYLIFELIGSLGLLEDKDTAELQKALIKIIPMIKSEAVIAGIFEMFRTTGIEEFYDNLTLKVVNIIPQVDVNLRISLINTLFKKYPETYDDYVFLLKYVVSDLDKIASSSKMILYTALKGINYEYEGIDLKKLEDEIFSEKFLMNAGPEPLLNYYHLVLTTPNISSKHIDIVKNVIEKKKDTFDPALKMMLQVVDENYKKIK